MATVDSIKTIADFFLLSVAWTLVLFSPIASSSLTGAGFIKLLSNTAIGAVVLSLVVHFTIPGMPLWHLGLKVLGLGLLILMSALHQDKKTFFMWILYALLILIFPYLLLHIEGPLLSLTPALFIFSAALLLGVITYSMVLGHWYLVVPKLSAHPLKVAAVITWIILAVKILWSSYSIYAHYDFFEEQTQLGAGYAFNWMLLTMRVSFGYVVILGMSFFNWKLLKLRSIQSSTGILYAMTFFVFIGELVSTYMFLNYGLYI